MQKPEKKKTGQNEEFFIKNDAKNMKCDGEASELYFRPKMQLTLLFYLPIIAPKLIRMEHNGMEQQLPSRITKPDSQHICD